MNILKPKKMHSEKLANKKIEDINDSIEYSIFETEECNNIKMKDIEFENCKFRNIVMKNAEIEEIAFIDTIFENNKIKEM